jgi:hypothetical protein
VTLLQTFQRLLVHGLTSCALVAAGLWASYRVEHEHGQVFMGYVGLLIVFCVFGLPLSLVVAFATELVWKRRGWLATSGLIGMFVSVLFLQTDRLVGGRFYFMSNPERAPIAIGRRLAFWNPRPNTIQSNVATYFPILVTMTFFLPLIVCPLLHHIGGPQHTSSNKSGSAGS